MKKVLLTFYGLVDELRIGELTQEEFEDCKEHRISPKDCDLDFFLGGWNEIESLDVNVDGQEVYSDGFDIEDEDCPHIVNTNPKDWDMSGCSEDQQKALAEEIAALGGNWEEEDSNEVFRNVFGFKKTLQSLGAKDVSPVAVQENLGIRACYYYEFEIPDDEEFDISKVKFAIDDSEFFSDCGERVIWSTIMYGNKPVALDEGNEDSSESIEFGFGTIHTNDSTGYIDYVESNIPYFDEEEEEEEDEDGDDYEYEDGSDEVEDNDDVNHTNVNEGNSPQSLSGEKSVVVNGLKFFLNTETKEAKLVANSYSGDIIVPEKITDEGVEYTVISFADECFKECKGLTSIIIPASVTSLGEYCFHYCTALTNITIPSSVTSIGERCFQGCSSLTSVTIPSSLTSLGDFCFCDCNSLTSITIPSSVTSLGEYCFHYCTALTNITIPSSVTSIGDSCFSHCDSLTSITIPSSVTSLGELCFSNCCSLTSITIPSSVTSLGDSCFCLCKGLTSITLGESVTSLGKECFSCCESLTSISIPSSVTSLGKECFGGCHSLTSITIGSSVKSIKAECFAFCDVLTCITCKNPKPPTLGKDAFYDFTYQQATLYVPNVDAYKKAKGWMNFNSVNKATVGNND